METAWLDKIQKEVGEIDVSSVREPTGEKGADEHFVGYLSMSLRQLYGLAVRLAHTSASILVEARYEADESLAEQYADRIIALKAKSDLLMEIFWVALKDEFHLWNKPNIGVRKGWQVVWVDQPLPPVIEEALGRILDI